MVLVNPPNLIEEHSLRFLHSSHEANKMKTFPTYNYNIPEKFDLDFSDKGNLIYITAEDKNLPADSNSVILVYKVGVPTVSSFYDVYHLYKNQKDILVDVTGQFEDYVTVAIGSTLHMFRQY